MDPASLVEDVNPDPEGIKNRTNRIVALDQAGRAKVRNSNNLNPEQALRFCFFICCTVPIKYVTPT